MYSPLPKNKQTLKLSKCLIKQLLESTICLICLKPGLALKISKF
jgi:hypothetical protein